MKKILALAAAAFVFGCSGSDDSSNPPGGGGTNPGEPNETIAQATPLTLGTAIKGTISTMSDLDVYKFTVPAGGATVHIATFDQGGANCDPVNGTVDPYVTVYDANGDTVAASDDTGPGYCESFEVQLAAGTNYVEVGGYPPTPFVYTLLVEAL